MVKGQTLTINVFVAFGRVLVNSAILIFLYRFLIAELGLAQFGVWSIVLGSVAVGRISDLGLSSACVKFVAKYTAHDDLATVREIINTTTSVLVLISIPICLAIVPLGRGLLEFAIVDPLMLTLAKNVLPLAALALFLQISGGAIRSSLEGIQRYDLRNLIGLGCSIFYGLACLLIVPVYGLRGLAAALIAREITETIASWLFFRRFAIGLGFPLACSKKVIREIWSYGLSFQVISLSLLFCEPTTKLLLSKFSGVEFVGLFEMAKQVVSFVRQLLVSSQAPIVASVAVENERSMTRIDEIFLKATNTSLLVMLVGAPLLLLCSPLISLCWFGSSDPTFTMILGVVLCGTSINVLAAPAYYVNLGADGIRVNLVGHLMITVANLVLGIVLGMFFGGMGVVVAASMALAMGSAYIILKTRFLEVALRYDTLLLLCFSGIALVVSNAISAQLNLRVTWNYALAFASFFAIVSVPAWRHSGRADVTSAVRFAFRKLERSLQRATC